MNSSSAQKASRRSCFKLKHAKTVLWRKTDNSSIEYAAMYSGDGCFALEGTILLVLDQLPTKVTYQVECDRCWRTRHVAVSQEQAGKINKLVLAVDENQHWQQNQKPLPFTKSIDADFEISPATNTLPIRRLNLPVGESMESTAVWVRFPSLKLEPLRQRYIRIDDKRYRYEAPDLGFQAQLEVDEDGFIVKYGDLWMRIA